MRLVTKVMELECLVVFQLKVAVHPTRVSMGTALHQGQATSALVRRGGQEPPVMRISMNVFLSLVLTMGPV